MKSEKRGGEIRGMIVVLVETEVGVASWVESEEVVVLVLNREIREGGGERWGGGREQPRERWRR